MPEMPQSLSPELAEFADGLALMAKLPADKLAHFKHLLNAMLNCYTTEQTRALVLLSEGSEERGQVSLIAVNADESETQELVDTLCVFRKLDFEDVLPVN